MRHRISRRLFLLSGLLTGCGIHRPIPSTQQDPTPIAPFKNTQNPSRSSIRLTEVTEQAGIHFSLGHGGRSPLTILETAGGGCAFLDYDADGWSDILLVGPYNLALYRNRRDGTFEDVTAQSGLDPHRYWMGCAVGDYDGDGLPDVFLSGYHCYALYHNEGKGRFREVTAESGIEGLDWSMSAAFADFTGSGRLDLFIGQYVLFNRDTPQICTVGRAHSACGPEIYQPLSGHLFLNVDGRRFRAIPWKDTGKTWGALASRLLDGPHPDLYLANDMMPGDLWTNQEGHWRNVGVLTGTAYDAQGNLQGGMGVDSADYDNDGCLDLIVTTYFAQPASLYHNDGNGLFHVVSSLCGIGPPTMPYVNFGTAFVDFDNDGWLDLILTNGHVRDNVHSFDAAQTYAQPVQVFHNQNAYFTEISQECGVGNLRLVGRGLTIGDYDHDGRQDVLICNLEGRSVLLRNVSEAHHWLEVVLSQPGMNRAALGAMVTLEAPSLRRIAEIRTSGSVLSAREPIAHFGLGDYSGPVTLHIRWPDGKTQHNSIERVDRRVTIVRSV
ncbi:MAG TPA: CRTAC1 family protein [Chthonomonas sp.]|uniref:CRTAC1 family protein n=1 Tax=Chthonomonas sp. TaxID=2282153 RepID=UPI002B4AEB87|nr:CRTAC1 family protein [Chthonomonas sp.]HLI47889.1 CRTAC1 family protein [Chthonomonas sp.]